MQIIVEDIETQVFEEETKRKQGDFEYFKLEIRKFKFSSKFFIQVLEIDKVQSF